PEVTRETAEVTLTVNRRERTLSNDQTYLAALGLAMDNDQNRFDQYNRLFPRTRDPQQGAPLRDFFVVFPHLTPFADNARLQAAERNDSLYRTPRPLLASQGPPSVFALRVRAAVAASTERSVLSLNSFQIRDGSERIYVGNTLLTRGVDYTIDYEVGQLQFKNPDSLFQGGVALVRAQFEERAAFTVAPTSIYGLAARYDLGAHGEVNVTGMFQREQSTFTRPPLGFEPASSFIGGISTQLRFEPAWVTRLVDALPGVRTDAPSFLNIAAEVAASKPQPNRQGQAYIEEFEHEQGRSLPLSETAWHWGSMPCGDPRIGCADGARAAEAFGISPAGFEVTNLAALTWQGLPLSASGPVQFLPQQIDPAIRTTGQAQSAEPVLWLMLKPDTVLGLANSTTGLPNWVRPAQNAPRWRSITQTLSTTGVDLSRVEVLEFWVWEDNQRVAKANRAAVLFDFGSVFEDGIAVVPDSFTVAGSDTTYHGARLAGAGRLDTERDSRTQSWSATINDQGILMDRVVDGIHNATTGTTLDTLPLCSGTENGQLVLYFFGDLRSRCGRRNGAVDSEDQDGDFRLDSVVGVRTAEDFVRYVFPIGDERYYVRDGGMVPVSDSMGGSASGWRLYRIPFRLDTIQV
ncbi:MAG: cell surface protein SprA, partial [Burkholderiales bacterium]